MKRLWFFVALIGACGASAFVVTHRVCTGDGKCDEMAWLTREFQLSETQAEKIKTIREKYEPVVKSNCVALTAAREQLKVAKQSATTNPEAWQSALHEWRTLSASCADNTRNHVRSVAAIMAPEQGQRYLALVLPKIAKHEHDLPPGLE